MKEKLMVLLKQQHLLWMQRAQMNPELHMVFAAGIECMDSEYSKLLEQDAQAVLELILGKD